MARRRARRLRGADAVRRIAGARAARTALVSAGRGDRRAVRHRLARAVPRARRRGPAKRVLVHGASGGVGVAAMQIARAHGMRVIGTAGTDKGLALVREQGAHEVLNHRDADYMQQGDAADRRPRRGRRARDAGEREPRSRPRRARASRARHGRRQPRPRRDRPAQDDGQGRHDPRHDDVQCHA